LSEEMFFRAVQTCCLALETCCCALETCCWALETCSWALETCLRAPLRTFKGATVLCSDSSFPAHARSPSRHKHSQPQCRLETHSMYDPCACSKLHPRCCKKTKTLTSLLAAVPPLLLVIRTRVDAAPIIPCHLPLACVCIASLLARRCHR
jgi:hypothetical protein